MRKTLWTALAMGLSLIVTATSGWAKQVTLGIDGMTCTSCARKIEKQLGALKAKGVESCKIDLESRAANVSIADHAAVTVEELKAAVKKAGYSVTLVTGF